MSLMLPAVSRKTRGRPCASVSAWSLLVRPPREAPIACSKAPFSAGRRAMCPDMGAVDRRRAVDAAVARQRLEYLLPQPLPAPAVEPVVDRRVGPIDRRTIAPAPARAQHVHNPTYHAPVINAMRPTPTPRQH